jgi:hypothetical protein
MSVVSDPIGTVLAIGPSSELQLMIGLEELIAYDSAMVRLEGRSRSTNSWVYFDVYNPWNDCGTDSYMSQDWNIHVVELDLDECMVPGQGFHYANSRDGGWPRAASRSVRIPDTLAD